MRLYYALDAEAGVRELVHVGAEWAVVRVRREPISQEPLAVAMIE